MSNEKPHVCVTCGALIDARFRSFRDCTACSMKALTAALTADGYYERQAARLEREAEEADRERMRAKGLLK